MLTDRWTIAALVYLGLVAAVVTYGASLGMLLSQQIWQADWERQTAAIQLQHGRPPTAQEEAAWRQAHPKPYADRDPWLETFSRYGGWWLVAITFGLYVLWATGALWELELDRSLRRAAGPSRRAARPAGLNHRSAR